MISNTGKLFSKTNNIILKTLINKEGYEVVCVSIGGRSKRKKIRIHIAVAYMSCDGYKKGLVVNHKDGNKLNNNSNNLEWITQKENVQHAADNRLLNIVSKKPVKQIDKDKGEPIRIFESVAEATREFNKNKSKNISEAIRVRNGFAYGYKWEYC